MILTECIKILKYIFPSFISYNLLSYLSSEGLFWLRDVENRGIIRINLSLLVGEAAVAHAIHELRLRSIAPTRSDLPKDITQKLEECRAS